MKRYRGAGSLVEPSGIATSREMRKGDPIMLAGFTAAWVASPAFGLVAKWPCDDGKSYRR